MNGTACILAALIPVIFLSSPAESHADDSVKVIRVDAASTGREFEGIGAVSAGASTRLLIDYPESKRDQILDLLFKPKFGAGFQHLKVEIGGGENSTCGCEPSHAITREELADPKPRGYEFWLMAEARKRNPHIILDCLPWAYPRWVGDRFSPESAEWFAAFLSIARNRYGLELDWVSAAQNEMGTDPNWIRKHLRPTLDACGFAKVRLQAPDDDSEYWQIFDELEKNAELDRLIGAVGYHYVDGREPWQIDQRGGRDATEKAKRSGKPLWASEEWSQSGRRWGDKGALYLARVMNKLYTRDRITKFEIWCPIDSIYDQIIWGDTGVMQADAPWCGHYAVWPAVWAVAHTTQFAEPGWVYLDDACGQLDPQTWRGSHVALRDPKTGDWSLIVVTGEKKKIQVIPRGLKSGPVSVWKSTADGTVCATTASAIAERRCRNRTRSGFDLYPSPRRRDNKRDRTARRRSASRSRSPSPKTSRAIGQAIRRDISPTRKARSKSFVGQKADCASPKSCRSRAFFGMTTGCSNPTRFSATRTGGTAPSRPTCSWRAAMSRSADDMRIAKNWVIVGYSLATAGGN